MVRGEDHGTVAGFEWLGFGVDGLRTMIGVLGKGEEEREAVRCGKRKRG